MQKQPKVKKQKSQLTFNEYQLVLSEGVHFFNVKQYFLELLNKFCLLSWLGNTDCYRLQQRKILTASREEKVSHVSGIVQLKGQDKAIVLQQRKLFLKNEVQYVWLKQADKNGIKSQIDLQIFFRIQVELGTKGKGIKNLIKIQIIKLSQSENTDSIFPFFKNITHKYYAYKPNFCEFATSNELTFPELKEPYLQKGSKDQNHLILLLSQNHMKQMPFFNGIIKGLLKDGKKLVKMIGHPINLLLVLLINDKHEYDDKIGEVMQNYQYLSQKTKNVISQQVSEMMERKLKDLILKILGQQNLLDISFVQFFSEHLVNQQFQKNFVQLVVLYYKIFLNEQITEQSIRLALANDFYISKNQEITNNTYYFSSILKFIQFKHDLACRNVMKYINHQIKTYKKKNIQEFTLLDLYRYNKIEFTFIGMDLEDQTVRFFNHQTTPRLPISAILSLIQIFPTPYKSIIWKQQWGRYKYFSKGRARYISLVGHQIIDSKYLLQCPLDLISDPQLRQCYFNNNTSIKTRIQAISSSRLNIQELKYVQDVKTLLKSMKNNAIQSLPKFKLVWKILTTKNRVQIDLNNVQTLYQIPILQKILKINSTLKSYLRNINSQVNSERIFKVNLPYYSTPKMQLQMIVDKTHGMLQLFENRFNGSSSIYLQNKSHVELQLQSLSLKKEIDICMIWTYGEGLQFISRVKKIIKAYDIQQKFLYQEKIKSISEEIDRHRWIFNIKYVEEELTTLLKKLSTAELKAIPAPEEIDLLKTSSRICQNFSYVYEENERLAFDTIIEQLKSFYRKVLSMKGKEMSIQFNIENLNLQFQRLTHSISSSIFQIMERKVQNGYLQDFLRDFFEYTPHFYNNKEIQNNRFFTTSLIKDFLQCNSQGKPFHIILSGHEDTLLLQANHLLSMRVIISEHKMSRIAAITSSGYHSVLAFLFCLNIKRDVLISQIIGLNSLMLTARKVVQDIDIDIIELLAKRIDSQQKLYYFGGERKLNEVRSRVHRKYLNLLSKFTQVQSTIQNGNQYKLQKIYNQIDHYDAQYPSLSIDKKSQQISVYLQWQLSLNRDRLRKVQLLLQNQQMLKEKIIFNKIGLSFFIKFLYSDPAAHLYWYNIHKAQYQQFAYYKLHLINLFKKYNVHTNITLQQFNNTNYHHLQLNFTLLNQTQLKYQYITPDNQSHLQLLDLLIASVSMPVFSGAYPLNTYNASNNHCKQFINKLEGKFIPSFPKQRYWSCGTLAPLPFHIIQAASQEHTVLGFELTHLYSRKIDFAENMIPQLRMMHNNSRSMKDQQNRNFKALDLISFWWTKPKKLSPQLKEYMFGSIYKSPFCRLYFGILNSSYANLNEQVKKRSILNLNDEKDFTMKQMIVCESLKQNQQSGVEGIFYLKLSYLLLDKTVIECIKSSRNDHCWLECEGQQVTQISKITINQHITSLHLVGRKMLDSVVKEYKAVVQSFKIQTDALYLEVIVSNESIIVSQIFLKSKQLIKNSILVELSQKRYKFKMCLSCGEPILIKSDKQSEECPLCFKKKQFKLCLLLSQSSESNFDKIIQEIRQKQPPYRRQTKSKFSRYICCLGCYKQT